MKWVGVFVRMHFKHTGIIGMVCTNCHLRLKQKPCQAEAPEHKLVYNVMNYPCLCSICWGNHSPQHTSILPACSMSTFDRRSITLTSSGSIPCSSDTHKHKHHKATSRGHSLSEWDSHYRSCNAKTPFCDMYTHCDKQLHFNWICADAKQD